MQSTKLTLGIFVFIVFVLGAGFIVVRFGDKSNDNPAPDTTPSVALVPVKQNTTPTVPVVQPIVGTPAIQTTPNTTTTVPVATPVNPTVPVTPKVTPVVTPAVVPVATSPYKDGTYATTGSYDSPAGMERIGVSITLSNGVVQNATVTNEATDRTSSRYQNMFISGYQQYVVGKSIPNLSLGRVSGSSLTPIGFNQAVAKIKSQAMA